MIGRWEFGAKLSEFKKVQIEAMWEWQVNELGLNPEYLYVSVYAGNQAMGISEDAESIEIWSKLFSSVGIEPVVEREASEYGMSRGGRIFVYNESENWWSRAGVPEKMPVGEPGGPDSEMFFDFDPEEGLTKDHPATETERFLEIGNNVFMAYKKEESGFVPLKEPNIDYGGGLERVAAALNADRDVYKTPFFKSATEALSDISGKIYLDNLKLFRVILDHLRSATFLVADGANPGNADAGYVTRRLIRRAIRTAKKLGIDKPLVEKIADCFIEDAKSSYPLMYKNRKEILSTLAQEEEKFASTLKSGEREIEKFLNKNLELTGKDAFYFYETFGFPLELTEEVLRESGHQIKNPELFEEAGKQHAELSRTASAGKFKGGLADHSDKTTALHTATHLMLAGLRKVLGDHVFQKGSNITDQRARFDFSHDEKMTDEEKQAVEEYVNQAIEANASVRIEEMAKVEAQELGVVGSFWEKYPDLVKVYVIEDDQGNLWSKELCGGPHTESTADLSQFGKFKIKKEQSSSSGVRRIKAVLA